MKIESKVCLSNHNDSLEDVIKKLNQKNKEIFGFVCILGDDLKLVGVFNSGDLLRALSEGNSLKTKIKNLMSKDPITIGFKENTSNAIKRINASMLIKTNGKKKSTNFIPVIDDNEKLVDVITYEELIKKDIRNEFKVAIYGLGFVGLTLAAAISSRNIFVKGIDISQKLISNLKKNKVDIHEPGLQELVMQGNKDGLLSFDDSMEDCKNYNVHIICVGSPIEKNKKPNNKALESIAISLSKNIKKNDLVIIRSTIQVGTTRNLILPILEQSGLKGGVDFSISFSPERTIEGNALEEVQTLPQIIGGLSKNCLEKSERFWSHISKTVVLVDKLEEAEFVKLLNNSYRDTIFAFSNAFVSIADSYNINALNVINAANQGYIRGNIPKPSPGVGGYCLTKDPYIYGSSKSDFVHSKLANLSRQINEMASFYPITTVKKYCQENNLEISKLNIFILGMAFKGDPPTNDLRGSISLETYEFFRKNACKTKCFDYVISNEKRRKEDNLEWGNLEEIKNSDVILILNNHRDNISGPFLNYLNKNKRILVFDGWGQLKPDIIERNSKWTYSTLGYITKKVN